MLASGSFDLVHDFGVMLVEWTGWDPGGPVCLGAPRKNDTNVPSSTALQERLIP